MVDQPREDWLERRAKLKEEAEQNWWMKPSLTRSEREALTADQKAERRLASVHWRLEEAENKLTTVRRNRMARWLRQWVKGEAAHEMMYGDTRAYSLKAWLRHEFVEAVKGAFQGRDMSQHIETTIRAEVGKVLTGNRFTADRQGREHMEAYVRKIVEDEVRKQVMASLTLDIDVKGRVFSPSAGQRRVDLGES